MAQKPEKYWHLCPMGRELHDYWQTSKPEMYRQMAAAGTLWPVLESEGDRLDEMVISLMQSGMSEDMAKETARAEIYENLTE